MVDPSAFAETVTPPILSPEADVMVPASRASAQAGFGIAAPSKAVVARRVARVKSRAVFMAFLR
jgi:hypothetical protein